MIKLSFLLLISDRLDKLLLNNLLGFNKVRLIVISRLIEPRFNLFFIAACLDLSLLSRILLYTPLYHYFSCSFDHLTADFLIFQEFISNLRREILLPVHFLLLPAGGLLDCICSLLFDLLGQSSLYRINQSTPITRRHIHGCHLLW